MDEPGVRESQQDAYGETIFQTPSGARFGASARRLLRLVDEVAAAVP